MTVYKSPFSNTAQNGACLTVASGGSGWVAPAGISNSKLTTSWSNTLTQTAAGQLELNGEQADLLINGTSLNDTLKLIQDRLNLLRPNAALEAEWDQLREIGDQYRRLEAELIEKQRAWEILKKTT